VLAALAVVGRASLSADELADLVEVADVAPPFDDLERRGLIKRERITATSHLGASGGDP
jgi:hypothetical protein